MLFLPPTDRYQGAGQYAVMPRVLQSSGMSRQHTRDVAFVKSLLNKPKWYNETLTHKNWPLIKKAIENMPDPLLTNPKPTLPEYNHSISDELILRAVYQPAIIRSNFIGLRVA